MSHYNRNQGGYYNRKRKVTEESTFDEDYKKQRLSNEQNVPIEDELETSLYRLGEGDRKMGFMIEQNIESVASYVMTLIHDRREDIINILIECTSKIPEKITIYSTLIGILNARNPGFVEHILDNLATSLKEFLKQGQYAFVHTMTRFISDLVNVHVLSTSSILRIYHKFIETISEANLSQVRTDFYVYCVLSAVPWNGKILYEKHGPEFDDVLSTIKSYIEKRKKDHLPLLKVWSVDDPHPQEDYLDCMSIQIKKLEENDWSESIIFRPYIYFEKLLANAEVHDFPLIVPPGFNEQTIYPLPQVIFRMFDYTDVPEEFILPGAHSIERFLVEEQIQSCLNTYYLDRKLCATKLLKLHFTNRIPLNYMIVEVIMGNMFNIPKSKHIEIFYGSLLIELCKLEPNLIPQVLAQATELLYERIDYMKATCIERFSSWFAYHLSNFQYKWSWEDWKECLNEDADSPKIIFLKETLIRCMRLSFHQRVVDFLPESMNKLAPINPKPTYKYVSEQAGELEGTAVANRLLELFKDRAIPEDVFQVLRDIPDTFNEADNEYETFNPLKIEVFTSTLLYFGSKSFSHAFAALAKYHMIFKMLVDNESSQLVVLRALYDVWKNHQQMVIVLVDKMLKTQIVECSSVIKWIFSDEMKHDFCSFYIWEIMHSTINRMSKQVDKVKSEYDQLIEKSKKSTLESEALKVNEVTEEELEQKSTTLNNLKEQQKTLFFLVIDRFVDLISNHLANTEKMEESGSKYWLKWINDRVEDILLSHHQELLLHLDELKSLHIKPTTPKHIKNIFKMFASLKN